MNSRKNHVKRVAAGALAVLTVAAYTAPVANVGGLPSVKSLVAEAAHSAIVSSSTLKNTTFEVDDYFAKDVTLNKASTDKTELKVKFGNEFEVGILKANNSAGDYAYDGEAITEDDNKALSFDGGFTISNVTSIEYHEKTKAGANAKVLVIKAKYNENKQQVTYVVKINGASAAALSNMYISVASNEGNTTTFEKKEAEEGANYAITLTDEAKDYIESFSYTTIAGDEDVLYAKTIKSMGNLPHAKDRTTVTIVSTALLDITAADNSKHPKTSYSNGKFTYTFDAVDNFAVNVIENEYDVNGGSFKVKRPTDEKAVELDGEIYSGSTITLTSENPFTIEKGAIKSQKANGTFTYDDVTATYKNGAFTATFVVADTALDIKPGNLDDVTFTYATSGQKITATGKDAENNEIITNAPVGSFTVTSKVPQYSDAAKKVIKKDNKGNELYTETAITNGKSIKYNPDLNSFIEADFTVDPNLLGTSGNDEAALYKIEVSNGTVKDTYTFTKSNGVADEADVDYTGSVIIKTNEATAPISHGIELDADVEGTPSFAVKMRDAGSYTITLYVWGQDNTAAAKKVSLSYTISKITSISASDFTLRGFYSDDKAGYENLRKDYIDALNDNTFSAEDVAKAKADLDTYIEENSLTVIKNASGVFEVGAHAEDLEDNNSVYLYAELPGGTPCEIINTKVLGKIGAKSTNTKIKVTDPNYSVSDTAITWTLVEAAVEDAIYFDYKDLAVEGMVTASYETLESTVKQCLKSTNKIDVKNATFKYTTVKSNDGLVDIDTLIDGLPTGDTINDSDPAVEYFIYAFVGDIETAEPLPIKIGLVNTKVQAVPNRTTFTYGEDIAPSDFKFVKAGTNTVIDGLAFNDGLDINDCVSIEIKKSGANGAVVDDSSLVDGHLIPGKYSVTLKYTGSDDLMNKPGYTFDDDDEKTNDGDGNVATKTFTITVNKEKLDGSMIVYDDGEIITKPIVNGVAKLNADVDFNFKDGNNEIPVRISGNTSTADAPGTYVVTLAVNNIAVPNSTVKWGDLYTGTVNVTWAAVKDANAFDEFVFDYEVEEDDYIHDNIYSENNKVYIHAEAKLMDEDYGELTTANEKKINIQSIGFVYEKEGKLKDLKNNLEDIEEATKSLQLGVCKSTNVGTQKNSNLIAGINSTVTSIDDYIWIRPYVVTKEGVVKYGTARRLDFTTVANKVIKPQLSDPQLVGKTVNGTAGIYNYVYAAKNTKNDVIYRTADPKAFGVVISRNGNYATEDDAIKTAYEASIANGTVFNEREYINNSDDKKYYEELKKAYNLTLDTADVSSKAFNNDNYTSDECGTLIKITDSLSRVYVRTYVDFGNGLVVYSAPKSIDSANSILADELFGLDTLEGEVRQNGSYPVAAVRNATNSFDAAPNVNTLKNVAQVFEDIKLTNVGSTDAAKQNQVSEFGLLLDTKGIVCARNYDENNFVLGAGFDVRKSGKPNQTNTNAAEFEDVNDVAHVIYGAITSASNKASVRAYLVYRGVTFYGDVETNVVLD